MWQLVKNLSGSCWTMQPLAEGTIFHSHLRKACPCPFLYKSTPGCVVQPGCWLTYLNRGSEPWGTLPGRASIADMDREWWEKLVQPRSLLSLFEAMGLCYQSCQGTVLILHLFSLATTLAPLKGECLTCYPGRTAVCIEARFRCVTNTIFFLMLNWKSWRTTKQSFLHTGMPCSWSGEINSEVPRVTESQYPGLSLVPLLRVPAIMSFLGN